MEKIDDEKEALPLFVPAVLSFVAGFVDSFTFLALFGLFVANVTGTFVIVGAEVVGHVPGVAAKLLAIIAFLLAAGLTAAFVAYARQSPK